MRFNLFLVAVMAIGMLFSCDKSELKTEEQGSLSFGAVSSKLKSGVASDLKNVTHVNITITKDGKIYKDFNLKSVKLNKWGGSSFTTEDVKLETGSGYKLEHFELQNSDNKSLFASPVKGSALASKVSEPLSIDFEIRKDERTNVVVEVLSTVKTTPADFGYAYFTIKVPVTKYRLTKKDIYRDSDKASFVINYQYSVGDQIDYFTVNGKYKTVCKYDGKGRIIEEIDGDQKNTYTYNDKGQLKEYYIGISKVFWRKDYKHVYEYNSKGERITEHVYSVEHDGSLKQNMRIEFENKNSVFVRKIVYRYNNSGSEFLTSYLEIERDANGNLETETEYSHPSKERMCLIKFYYEEI